MSLVTRSLVVLAGLAPLSSAWAEAEDGRAIYVAKCQACHGAGGKGDGPAARALPKKPKDFTSPDFWASTTDENVKTVVLQGMPGTIMRGFPMAPEQLADLLAYLRSLSAPTPSSP